MSEEANPYRSPAVASDGPATEIGSRLTLSDLKAISRGRRKLGALLFVHGLSFLNLLAAFLLMPAPHVHPGQMWIAYGYWFMIAGAFFLLTLIGLFFVGSRLVQLIGDRSGGMLTIGLLFPGLNAIAAVMLLVNARRTLVSRNVRLGWLKDDLSEADADRSFWRQSGL